MKTVAFVPIKLNSQRLPHKNVLPILGKPMCWHICNTLLKVKRIDEIYVFCSDESIKEYLPEGVRYLKRDAKLDKDFVKGSEIYKSFIGSVDADIYVLAHTTSPFIECHTIDYALEKVQNGGFDSAFTAERVQTFAWYRGNPVNYSLTDVPRTQDIEPVWIESSGFYIFRKEIFTIYSRRIGFRPYIQEVRGAEKIDIDTREDYELAIKINEGEINE